MLTYSNFNKYFFLLMSIITVIFALFTLRCRLHFCARRYNVSPVACTTCAEGGTLYHLSTSHYYVITSYMLRGAIKVNVHPEGFYGKPEMTVYNYFLADMWPYRVCKLLGM